ncbi:putative ABC transport system permease protein [Devosia sp. UYZn731]|uniref:FtsX-like permease family protein n=1 Tax=Devosia sp. UYZn731 TaxID=3156345 RepID=UPI003398842E
MIIVWLVGLFRTRMGRLAGTIAGIALAVALLCDLGTFIQQSSSSMTMRAIASVPVDWQVELVPGADLASVSAAIDAAGTSTLLEQVGYASVDSFEFTTADGTQTTGAGKVIGIGPDYITHFPAGFRMLAGDASGALLLQQTAANLHAVPGDAIMVHRPGLPAATITITGIVDLKTADTVFQAIGVPAGAAPQAPPDNAVIMPGDAWHVLFDPQASLRPQDVRTQLHASIDHAHLPADPNDAYRFVTQAGHNLELRVAGSALLTNNLAAQLDAARGDALYARVLFLFLGAPGVILAGLLTTAIAGAGAERRKRDLSLLRLRGASRAMLTAFSAAETATVGLLGGALGIALTLVTAPLFGQSILGEGRLAWSVIALVAGLALAGLAVMVPAWQSARSVSVVAARQTIGAQTASLWERINLDLLCLVLAALVFAQTAASGYQVVLATEGVTAVSVDYTAFLAPVLLWIGSGLLTVRLTRLLLGPGRKLLNAPATSLGGSAAPALVASLFRQRRRLSVGVAFAALAIAFAVSTAVFNTTYQGQSRVDALLTNGADVTVTGTTAAPAASIIAQLRAIDGVAAAEPMQHRFAYVGTDLQDLYGIDPAAIRNATPIVNAYFGNGDANAALGLLSSTENAALVSDETVTDFQLTLGDTINLRLQSADGAYHPVPFVFAGVIREFPTAPRDSFIVANAAYVAKVTGVDASETVLMRTSGDATAIKAAAMVLARDLPSIQVNSLSDASHIIGSSLTAVDLSGLTRLELSFAIILGIGATALILSLGLADRRRSFAILSAVGASRRQMAGFILAEGGLVITGGMVFGAVTGWLVAQILVIVLQGVFDPPPEAMSAPWPYLAITAALIIAATLLALINAIRDAAIDPVRRLRELQ